MKTLFRAVTAAELETDLTNQLNNKLTDLIQEHLVSKFRVLILLAFISLFGYTNIFAQFFSGGDGSVGDPWRISNMADWEEFVEEGPLLSTTSANNFRLTADIGSPQNPVTQMAFAFPGLTFDGGGHTIYVAIRDVGFVGLFSGTSSVFPTDPLITIKNFTVRGRINNEEYLKVYE